jgi:hypothetical protein
MGKSTCSVDGCSRVHKAHGYCEMHWRRVKRTGTPGRVKSARGVHEITADGYEVRGSGHTNLHGYRVRMVPGHPNAARRTGQILEHRLVMATHLARPLFPDETVHHKNGVRTDNRIENLELRAGPHGKHQTTDDLVAAAVSTLRRYAPELLAVVQLRKVA